VTQVGAPAEQNFPFGGEDCGALIRGIDWSTTPLGPTSSWPEVLRATLQTLLASRHPMFLWWGPELIQFYNDAYRPSLGALKHPVAMGQRGRDCWGEIWPVIGPQIDGVMSRGEATWHEDALVPIERNGRMEEVFWSYGYSPVFDAAPHVGGTLVVCTETTGRVLAERRERMLNLLTAHTADSDDDEAALGAGIAALSALPADVPFAMIVDSGSRTCIHAVGLPDATVDALRELAARAAEGAEPVVQRLRAPIKAGPWPEPVVDTFAVQLDRRHTAVFGLSPRLPLDDGYRGFLLDVVGTLRAALARREALDARANAVAERRNLLLEAPIPTALMIGPEHTFQLANRRYVEMVGREVEGLAYFDAFPELRDTTLAGVLDDVYLRGKRFVVDEMLVPLVDGPSGTRRDRYFKFNLEPLREVDGTIYGMIAMAIEVSEIVRARQMQADAHARMQAAHDERTALVEELERASRTKDEFLAMLGHELRNPLAPIVTALALLKTRAGWAHTEEQRVIEGQVAHLTRLVDDLLDVSKITRGKVELRREVTDVREVVNKSIELAAHLIEQREHALAIDVPPEPVEWYGDPTRLAQVVANLLTNAARYTDHGGELRVRVESGDGDVRIRVTDNGIGIAPELLPNVFEMFVQGARSTDRSEGGLGIGLALTKALVTLHGGSVRAFSEGLGRGSEFVVELPIIAPPERPTTTRSETGTTASTPKRVLVVDDNEDAADMLAEYLRMHGHEVTVAHDPLAALEVFAALQPDVAVLDIGLPVMDGYELAGRLRELDASHRCRLIALTGYGQESDRVRAISSGFQAHLVKPVRLDLLLTEFATPD